MATTSTLIPEGFTFLNKRTFLSVKAHAMVIDLLRQSDNRNPDAHDMYIYNDFYGYAVLDLVDRTLSKLHGKVVKKEWKEAVHIAEALTQYISLEDSFTDVDDGDRVRATNTAYGALLIKTLREFKSQGHLNAAHYPSLESFLKAAADLNDFMDGQGCDSSYGITEDQKQLEKAMVEEWMKKLDIKEEDEDEDEANGQWFSKADLDDENLKDPDFTLSRTWKDYKDYIRGGPLGPFRGPSWDISSWSADEKRPFLFESMGGMDDDFF
ncbi:hypothetical protein GYMLUDRAFT_54564 [Collybiopsis luxurians FD-317 M1]|nr:hypothetical protein GYMLUDRAFT_54564 [Collybiopsis luxurians FD-317 M1]